LIFEIFTVCAFCYTVVLSEEDVLEAEIFILTDWIRALVA